MCCVVLPPEAPDIQTFVWLCLAPRLVFLRRRIGAFRRRLSPTLKHFAVQRELDFLAVLDGVEHVLTA